MAEKYCYDKYPMMFFWGREDEEKTRQKNGQTSILQNRSFWTYIKIKCIFTFWCMVIPLGPHLIYTY